MEGARSPGHCLVSAEKLQVLERTFLEIGRLSGRLLVYANPDRERILQGVLKTAKKIPGADGAEVQTAVEKAIGALGGLRKALLTGDLVAAVDAALTCERWSTAALAGLAILQGEAINQGEGPKRS